MVEGLNWHLRADGLQVGLDFNDSWLLNLVDCAYFLGRSDACHDEGVGRKAYEHDEYDEDSLIRCSGVNISVANSGYRCHDEVKAWKVDVKDSCVEVSVVEAECCPSVWLKSNSSEDTGINMDNQEHEQNMFC